MRYGPFELATVRPETKFGDTAVAVNPKDKRYTQWIGTEIAVEGLLGKFKIRVVGDHAIDPKFGTGVAKVTPAHDFTDFEIAKRHNLEFKEVINKEGKLTAIAGPYAGLRINKARELIVEEMKKKNLVEKIDENYTHTVSTCYRCGRVLEPLLMPQWYIKVRPLADKAKEFVNKGEIRIYPKRFMRQLKMILDNFIDWNISRQVVWGIRIPAWQCGSCKHWVVTDGKPPATCEKCGGKDLKQDGDTFDTWFSSAQWPFVTLMTDGKGFYEYFYPTAVMETGHDILRAWVARMIMVDGFATEDVPFKNVFLHGMVRDGKGQKMSKSKGNVINPMVMVDKYGADALRAALIFGTKEGGDVVLSEQKIIGMRNFMNKIWNIGRFIEMNLREKNKKGKTESKQADLKTIKSLKKEFEKEKKKYLTCMKTYRFSMAFDGLYHFLWHRFADYYIEQLKEPLKNGNIEILNTLEQVYFETLKMLHPFIPFVTDAVWRIFKGDKSSILMEKI